MTSDPTTYQIAILRGLQGRPVFEGITDETWAKVDKRRKRNKAARAVRRLQRLRRA